MFGTVSEAAGRLNRYPDRDFMALRQDLAEYLAEESGVSIPASRIWAANGSNEVMLHILQAFAGPGRTVVSFQPTYSMYSEYARDVSSRWVTGERTESFELDMAEVRGVLETERPAVLLLTSPNNPTGTALLHDQIVEILDRPRPKSTDSEEGMATLVVIDEAYAEFRRDGIPFALHPDGLRFCCVDVYPHDVQGVRRRGPSARVPRRQPGRRRSAGWRSPLLPSRPSSSSRLTCPWSFACSSCTGLRDSALFAINTFSIRRRWVYGPLSSAVLISLIVFLGAATCL